MSCESTERFRTWVLGDRHPSIIEPRRITPDGRTITHSHATIQSTSVHVRMHALTILANVATHFSATIHATLPSLRACLPLQRGHPSLDPGAVQRMQQPLLCPAGCSCMPRIPQGARQLPSLVAPPGPQLAGLGILDRTLHQGGRRRAMDKPLSPISIRGWGPPGCFPKEQPHPPALVQWGGTWYRGRHRDPST